jgi:plastocyanin
MMKTVLPLNLRSALSMATFAVLTSSSLAAVHTVTCQNGESHFLPVTVNAFVGDTILWTWISGTHVVGPISAADIPVGAGMWNVPVNSSMQSFEYVVSLPGEYHYVCHPSNPHDEDGFISVSMSTGTQQVTKPHDPLSLFPVPSNGRVTVNSSIDNASFTVFNSLGEEILRSSLVGARADLDLSDRPKGIYFVQLAGEEGVLTRRVVIQ